MINRRQFISTIGALGLTGAATAQDSLIKPERIRPGDKVGLVNPATAAFESEPIEIMIEALESMELEVVLGNNYYNRHGYFAGTDADRASDLNTLFRDPDIKMIFARGGWGSARVLPLLDYDAIRGNPKVLLGYSDATALLTGVHAKTGLVTFHGPSPLNNFSAEYFRRVVMNGEQVTMINPTDITEETLVQTENRIQTIKGGKANGRVFGGNLTVLTAIMGSSYLPDWDNSILFLEDVNEAVYRVDRMLTELSLAGVLGKIKGFVFGRCTECQPDNSYGSLTLEQVLAEHIKPLGIPAFSGSMIGHIEQQFTIPLGIDIEIDADAGSIRMLEAGVI
ncbi:MAG: LD-carboxypeptidase [Gammaproteobacteria bacterium]|nr:MAG: LD-carboxypeptidase [Gammaproteobacteria bacterium]RLA38055.1 MAG: LD-carboxypeptidase [Gammaproteobacteria bacterium]